MDNRKQQPFYVGQRVVCVDDSKNTNAKNQVPIKKGMVYCVLSLLKAPCCNHWLVDIGIRTSLHTWSCIHCHSVTHYEDSVWRISASRFAPYDPPSIEIPAELLKEPVEERSDAPAVLTPDLLTPQPNP